MTSCSSAIFLHRKASLWVDAHNVKFPTAITTNLPGHEESFSPGDDIPRVRIAHEIDQDLLVLYSLPFLSFVCLVPFCFTIMHSIRKGNLLRDNCGIALFFNPGRQ